MDNPLQQQAARLDGNWKVRWLNGDTVWKVRITFQFRALGELWVLWHDVYAERRWIRLHLAIGWYGSGTAEP